MNTPSPVAVLPLISAAQDYADAHGRRRSSVNFGFLGEHSPMTMTPPTALIKLLQFGEVLAQHFDVY